MTSSVGQREKGRSLAKKQGSTNFLSGAEKMGYGPNLVRSHLLKKYFQEAHGFKPLPCVIYPVSLPLLQIPRALQHPCFSCFICHIFVEGDACAGMFIDSKTNTMTQEHGKTIT